MREWFSDFRTEVLVRPEILEVCMRLKAEYVFDEFGQQVFRAPSAAAFFASEWGLDLDVDQLVDGAEEGNLRDLLAAAAGWGRV